MLAESSVQDQLDAARHDALRVLVVGAGVAGSTVAQLLRAHGVHPVLVERAGPDAGSGYMLALMPLVDPVIAALGVAETYRAASTPLRRYEILSSRGRRLREYGMTKLLAEFGDNRGLSRASLLRVLHSPGGAITHRATVSAITQTERAAVVTIDSGDGPRTGEFDVVVVADGLHSTTRDLVLEPGEVTRFDTGWGGWVTWSDPVHDAELGRELWGAGAFVGSYPVADRLGYIVCGPRDETRAGPRVFTDRVRRHLPSVDAALEDVLDVTAREHDPYFWRLDDCRTAAWSRGRVVLLGDAAAGFLPTAGIGAGMAMESAWVLAGRLADTSPGDVPHALRAYERAQRPRVEAAQDNSRQLAGLMFRRSRAFAVVRDLAARFMPLEMAIRPIRRLLRTSPQPQAAAPSAQPPRR
ncbi:monooxygenase FAD-binding [Beutenbergia cavernae DSM 12333]|uniref:Monooxygenase FAD-binding n=1 Tax=Beutenbergia cavernae (strain ATCC BAA-8 / DSM 12333 / CCUG 43141 / JCM 11478 / NBRC 16432 / NCIMB 13614 / HKI 0122) TaxID=471853 RepID=C5BYC4_BEUC1|nr:NAD(P)/FAD-dependent oxidoreductase [Beutenbergia cavernae]ACQ81024.1 monooxygenase FAD-binding [Beutenbergia cavernae DSM 12333]